MFLQIYGTCWLIPYGMFSQIYATCWLIPRESGGFHYLHLHHQKEIGGQLTLGLSNDYQWLSKTIKDYQRVSKTIKDYQRLSPKRDQQPVNVEPLVHILCVPVWSIPTNFFSVCANFGLIFLYVERKCANINQRRSIPLDMPSHPYIDPAPTISNPASLRPVFLEEELDKLQASNK